MRHFYEAVPGWFNFEGVYRDAVAEAPAQAVFVEIGVWKGKSAAFMAVEIANAKKDIAFYAVDHWKGSDEPLHRVDPDVIAGTLYEAFLSNIAPAKAFVRPLRMTSLEAAERFDDQSVDLVLLDGEHTYEAVSADIAAWLPKLKSGATLAGDDWNWEGVQRAAVEAFGDRIEVLGEGKSRHWRVRL
jgi:hypothetical protein